MTNTLSLPNNLDQRLAELQNTPKGEYEFENGATFREKKPAAVLLPLLFRDNEWHLLYTRRVDGLMNHGGQVSFPGGGWEPGDADLTATALREAWEEVGIHPQDVQVLGTMQPIGLITGFVVTPVVGKIPWPYPIQRFDGEVARVFTVPLSWLADPSNYYNSTIVFEGKPYEVSYYKLYDGEKIWGATAKITQDFIGLLI